MSTSKQRPSTTRRPPQPQAEQKPIKKKERSTTEKVLVWGGIGLLCLVVVYEAGAKFSHMAAVRSIENVQEAHAGQPITIDEVRYLIKRDPVISDDKMGLLDVKIFTWTWNGVFKKHVVQLTVDEDNEITDYDYSGKG